MGNKFDFLKSKSKGGYFKKNEIRNGILTLVASIVVFVLLLIFVTKWVLLGVASFVALFFIGLLYQKRKDENYKPNTGKPEFTLGFFFLSVIGVVNIWLILCVLWYLYYFM